MAVRTILFVDDEPRVLDALRRMLYGQRREWQMEFVDSGPKALERLAAVPFEIVVTDMRMPGMDGAQLLQEIMGRYPGTMRIVLSGQCDRQAVLRTISTAHQFLTKPCDAETLKATLVQACRRRDQLADERYQHLLLRVTSVPSHPARYAALVAEAQSPQASIRTIGQIVASDIGLTAKFLQLVSTGFFGTPQRVYDAEQAVSLFDVDIIRAMLAGTDVFTPLEGEVLGPTAIENLWDHSLSVAAAAKRIAEAETKDRRLAGDAYLAGLLHDAGALLIAQHLQPQRVEIASQWLREGGDICSIERQHLGVTHADLAGYLLALWGLPDPIVQAVALHHEPGSSSQSGFTALSAVHAADAIDEERFAGGSGGCGSLDAQYLERLGLLCRLDAWREICHQPQPEGVAV